MSISTFEILNKFENCKSDVERIKILKQYSANFFLKFLKYAFDPDIQFYIKEFPKDYVKPIHPGLKYANIETELHRTYLFIKGNEVADSLSEKKMNQLLVSMLESFEYEEAVVFINMMKKDLNIPHLTYNLIKETFPELLP